MSILDIFKKEKKKPEETGKSEIVSKKKEVVETPAKKKEVVKVSLKKSVEKKNVKKVVKKEKALSPGNARIDQGAKGGEKLSYIIESPRITEKASFQAADGVYTFNVHPKTNKIQVKKAIKEIYNIDPVKVNIITSKKKNVFIRGKKGTKAAGKKALVYLKEGDKIEFV